MKTTRFLPLAAGVLLVPAAWLSQPGRAGPGDGASQAAAAPTGLNLADWPISAEAARGRVVFERYCIGCHGPEGAGDGAAAEFLDPLPRNFQKGQFKFRSTAQGQLPMEDDLLRTVTCGLPGSSMPGFPLVAEVQRRDVVAYVLHLATFGRGKVEADYLRQQESVSEADLRKRIPDLHRQVVADALHTRTRVPLPAEPVSTPQSIARGAELYDKTCASCHGKTGRGDGFSAYTLRDYQDAVIRPRDFTSGVFRSGSTATDLYLRLKTGLNGTPMPAISDPDDVLWSLVHYIQSQHDERSVPVTRRMGCFHEVLRREGGER